MFYKIQKVVIFWVLVSVTSFQGTTQQETKDPVSYVIKAPDTIKPGDHFTISVVFDIAPNWYVYAPIDINTTLGKIPTKISFKASEGFKKMGGLELPDDSSFFDTYSGKGISMSQTFQVEKSIQPGKQTIKAHIVYQTCNGVICYPPVNENIDIVLTVNK